METNTENINLTENTEGNPVSVFQLESLDTILNTLNGTEPNNDIRITGSAIQSISESQDNSVSDAGLPHDIQTGIEEETYATETAETISLVGNTENEVIDSEEAVSFDDVLNGIEHDFDIMNEDNNEHLSRFSGAEWFNTIQGFKVIIAGVGGIGSHLAFMVSRLNPMDIFLFDPDTVETANLSGQLFSTDDIGSYKSVQIRNFIRSYSAYYSTNVFNERYTGQLTSDIMLCGFDNMTARRLFFDSWRNHVLSKPENERKNCLLLDGRLGLEMMQIFTVRGDETENMIRYKKEFLFDDSEAEQIPCSLKQTSFMASMIASVMTNLLVNHAVNIKSPMDIRPIPFLTMYNAEDMRMQLKF